MTTCLLHFLFSSLTIVVVFSICSYLISTTLDRAFPTLYNLLDYEEALKEDHFSAIPLRRFKQCCLMIFDENQEVLFTTHPNMIKEITSQDLEMINDYESDTFYNVLEGQDPKTQEKIIYVLLNTYDYENEHISLISACTLNEQYQIIQGNLFTTRERLTQKDMNLIQGFYDKNNGIEKYVYENNQHQQRTLVFINPIISAGAYATLINRTNMLWVPALAIIFLMMILQSLLLSRMIKHSVLPLNQAINSYEAGKKMHIDQGRIPLEFQKTIDSFENLLDRLDQVQKEKDQMAQQRQRTITNISHDLKTPLTVIKGYANALSQGIVPADKQDQYLQTISHRANMAASLIDSLFEYVQMEHPEFKANLQPTDLVAFMQNLLAQQYHEITSQGFELQLFFSKTPLWLMMDEKLMARLLENLIGNALKYNPVGTTITIIAKQVKNQIYLTVADNGIGIPPEIIDTAFDPFITGRQTRSNGKGTGLGLSISYRIVSLHHGQMALINPPTFPYHTEIQMIFPII